MLRRQKAIDLLPATYRISDIGKTLLSHNQEPEQAPATEPQSEPKTEPEAKRKRKAKAEQGQGASP